MFSIDMFIFKEILFLFKCFIKFIVYEFFGFFLVFDYFIFLKIWDLFVVVFDFEYL